MSVKKHAAKQQPLPVAGIRLGVTSAGIRKADRPDLVVVEIDKGANCAAVFTRNAFSAAPVLLAKEHLAAASPRFLLINTGYANAGTGAQGMEDARQCCAALAKLTACDESEVIPFSTGVIGEPLPVSAIVDGLPKAVTAMSKSGWSDAAEGIMTTDTAPKIATRSIEINQQAITITGIAKGAGMIRPDMATMLAFVATDISLQQSVLQQCLNKAVDQSFNRITVDGDTSTNDACVLIATGKIESAGLVDSKTLLDEFTKALSSLCEELARAIVSDGEGSTKLVTVRVEGGRDKRECALVAYTIAHSPLVKTAMFAGDPNWGRILAALGRAEIKDLDISRVDVYLGDVCIVQAGARSPSYTERQGQDVMARDDIVVRIELGRGSASDQVWTCDLSYDYVRINAEYRT